MDRLGVEDCQGQRYCVWLGGLWRMSHSMSKSVPGFEQNTSRVRNLSVTECLKNVGPEREAGESWLMSSLIICTIHQTSLDWPYQGGLGGQTCFGNVRTHKNKKFLSGNLKRKEKLLDVRVDGTERNNAQSPVANSCENFVNSSKSTSIRIIF
jgi:hypothetical protein